MDEGDGEEGQRGLTAWKQNMHLQDKKDVPHQEVDNRIEVFQSRLHISWRI